jgi:glutathione synthase/RimK-type ligase-like ATP-grasp enzyme
VLLPLGSLRAAIESAEPDLIIPCDDDAAVHLYQLYMQAGKADPSVEALRALIVRSLGTPAACELATARGQFLSMAAEEGIRIPATSVVTTPSELNDWFVQHEFPTVIKIDRTWGGQGVSIVHNHEEAWRVFGQILSRPAIVKTVVHVFLGRDLSFLLKRMRESRHTMTVQGFIQGSPANRAVACWQGKVLAGISVEAIRTQHPTGPATVVQVIENPEMSEAVNRLVRRLGISGLWGFDFILEPSTGAAYMIEVNPRATPICHLPLGAGQNLPEALYMQLTGARPVALPATMEHDIIALFPGEWHRNPASPYLRSDYHDIPLDEPGLIQDGIDRPWSERGLIARLWARIRAKSPMPPIEHEDPMGVPSGSQDCSIHRKPEHLVSSTLLEK